MRILNFGSINIDRVFPVEEIARPGQTISSAGMESYPGGKGFNQSLALAKAGAEVYHAGMIGSDGIWLREMLISAGVNCAHLKMAPCATGSAFIQVDHTGQNCIVLTPGANAMNTPAFSETVLSCFSPNDILLLQNEINEIEYLVSEGSRRGMRVVLNPSPMNERVLSCDLSRISWFIINEDEGNQLTGERDPDRILDYMESQYSQASVVLTLGERGAMVLENGKRFSQGAYATEVVDTTGAGDTFTGFFLAGLAAGRAVSVCLDTALRAASIAISRKGAGTSIPDLWEVLSAQGEGR